MANEVSESDVIDQKHIQEDADHQHGHGHGHTTSFEQDSLPDGWIPQSSIPTNFLPEHFEKCMDNLLRNPNVLSSHLFRADVLYDSNTDKALLDWTGQGLPYQDPESSVSHGHGKPTDGSKVFRSLTQHMRAELRPRIIDARGFKWQRTVVREMVPRNQNLDKKMIQTVHFFSRTKPSGFNPNHGSSEFYQGESKTSLVFYLPHISSPQLMPFYHPKVQGLCFIHTCTYASQPHSAPDDPSTNGHLSISILPFPSLPLTSLQPLPRIVHNLLTTISKHSHGAQNGYQKRVNHDVVVPQRRFQDTYARLKEKYARGLCEGWQEVTDPGKHVFEDVGIAAFLVELWGDMYDLGGGGDGVVKVGAHGGEQNGEPGGNGSDLAREAKEDGTLEKSSEGHDSTDSRGTRTAAGKGKPMFPGFVDIGCGNGLLVHLLRSEGYEGWGFDVRARKSWAHYPQHVQDNLKALTLVPDVLFPISSPGTLAKDQHPGIFPSGTFIISNHADELTPWTPLLGYLNNSPWIAIPCCSHSLSGKRFRAPISLRSERKKIKDYSKDVTPSTSKPRTSSQTSPSPKKDDGKDHFPDNTDTDLRTSQAAETGSLLRSFASIPTPHPAALPPNPSSQKKGSKTPVPSAYSSLTAYVSLLAGAMGFHPETEMLRIPSTRNACIVGRSGEILVEREKGTEMDEEERERRKQKVRAFVEGEMGMSLEEVGREWLERAGMISGKKGEGH
ncbi:hypothetical protein BDZ85DRAFT_254037 [Elsinoe ampelina]|uniref:tRNA (uracil-O(2)-)-methyltransferase n=1 Tax=Elsinoe ampelina TaxID=302913 RepID=A0A6A6GP69_9PEZI|nr:hypothetical protein BDZ85DRAFT_254037 [Elsinoe ampelina]